MSFQLFSTDAWSLNKEYQRKLEVTQNIMMLSLLNIKLEQNIEKLLEVKKGRKYSCNNEIKVGGT